MSSRIVIALLASVVIAAAGFSTDASAARGGGGGHGGGGFHGGGFRGGGFHGGFGGFHGFAGHGFAGHGFGIRSFAGHRFGLGGVGRHGFAGIGLPGRFDHGFAAERFRGLYGFNRAGFNRNIFGNRRLWSGWGWGWGGWAGPVFWPFLYGDAFSFALWPYGSYDPFWALGPDFLLGSIFSPGPYYGPDYGYAGSSDVYYGATRADGTALARTTAAAAQSCSGLAPGVSSLPIEQIRKTIHPTSDQAAALDELGAAATKANDIIKASCPSAIPLTPIARLGTAEQRLDAMIEAVQIVRAPLEAFYESLSDQQKQRFDAMAKSATAEAERNSTAAGDNLPTLCSQQAGDFAKLPVQRIEQVVEPNAQQQSALEDLKKTSEQAADVLQASCPTAIPATPVARLDAVEARLGAMVDAMKTVRPKLKDFYDSLSDEQKAKFNIMSPPQNASAPPQHQSSDE